MKQTQEQKDALAAAEAAAPSEAEQKDIASRIPPLVRDDEHSFVPVEDTDRPTEDVDVSPTEAIAASDDSTLTMTRPDRAKSTYERSAAVSETDLERMTDDQIAAAKVLTRSTPRFHPARLAPSSDRPRQPGERAPAAGAGTWPMNESQMPAVMPNDPPVDDLDDRAPDNGFARAAGFKESKDGTLARKGLRIEKNEITAAAALYARLRQQFPGLTSDQLADEFELQWLSGTSGMPQSHREGEGLSQHGITAVGDDRVQPVMLGHERATNENAFEADPEQSPPSIPSGAPSENEPASTAVDDAKKPSGETAAADKKAAEQIAKFDHDGDGNVGGSKPKK